MTHEPFDVMWGVLQASPLQLLAKQPAELQAPLGIGVVDGEEDGVAFETVVEVTRLALILPILQERVRHRIVMDGEEEIGRRRVGARHAVEQALSSGSIGHQQNRFGKDGGAMQVLKERYLPLMEIRINYT